MSIWRSAEFERSTRRRIALARKFLADESGTELLEWILVAVVLVMTVTPVLLVIAGDLRDTLEIVSSEIKRVLEALRAASPGT